MEKTLKTYLTGFICSLLLTLVAFYLTNLHVSSHHLMFSHSFLVMILISLAMLQLVVQLVFFLHLAQEKRPRWNALFFIATFSVVLTIVLASIWIMSNLNYRMTPQQVNNYIINQDSF